MRILFTIPHRTSRPSRGQSTDTEGVDCAVDRSSTLIRVIASLHRHFGQDQTMTNHAERRTDHANELRRHELHIVVLTSSSDHALRQLGNSKNLYEHRAINDEPRNLGFHGHRILRDRWGNYDFYCYLQDDLVVRDPWMFEKLRWFNEHVGDSKVLVPNRFELNAATPSRKSYLDGDLAPHVTSSFQTVSEQPELTSHVLGQPVRFVRPLNPHAGCFFLNANQMQRWSTQANFAEPTSAFIDAERSAVTLGIMKTFQVYKPSIEDANFLEVERSDARGE